MIAFIGFCAMGVVVGVVFGVVLGFMDWWK